MIFTHVHSEYYGERDCLRVDLGGACGFIGRGCGLHGMHIIHLLKRG